MADPQTENTFPIQIRHDVDGWFFLAKEYNEKERAWLYECPSCKAQIIVVPIVQDSVSEHLEPLLDTQSPQQQIQESHESEDLHSLELQSEESETEK